MVLSDKEGPRGMGYDVDDGALGGIYDVGRHRIGIGVDSEVDIKI